MKRSKRLTVWIAVACLLLTGCSLLQRKGPDPNSLRPLEEEAPAKAPQSAAAQQDSAHNKNYAIQDEVLKNGLHCTIYDNGVMELYGADVDVDILDNRVIKDEISKVLTIKIGEGVRIVGKNAFNKRDYASVTGVVLSDSVEIVEKYAFAGCTGLLSVDFGNGIRTIEDHAFDGCTSLKMVALSDSVETIGEYAFSGCSAVASVDVGAGTQAIGNHAFEGCSALKNVKIEGAVFRIGDYAFADCTYIKVVVLGDSVREIGEYAFSGCSAVTSVTIGGGLKQAGEGVFANCGSFTTLTIASDVLKNMFKGMPALSSVTMKAGVTTIGQSAFADCAKLYHVEFPEDLVTIEARAFAGCTSLNDVSLPRSVASIGREAFAGDKDIKTVEIPGQVKTVGQEAFRGCSGMDTLTVRCAVSLDIEYMAFADCTNLNKAEFVIDAGARVTIGDFAFSGCKALPRIDLKEGVVSLGDREIGRAHV